MNKSDDALPNDRGALLDVFVSCKNLISLDAVLLPNFAVGAIVLQYGLKAIEGIRQLRLRGFSSLKFIPQPAKPL
jgi:hypothetical protein